MEVKKSPKADLEGKKSTGLLIGYVMVLAIIFAAFEWTQRDRKIDTSGQVAEVVFEEEIEIPITEQPEQVAAPPPPEAPSIAETLTIVDDDSDVQQSAILSAAIGCPTRKSNCQVGFSESGGNGALYAAKRHL